MLSSTALAVDTAKQPSRRRLFSIKGPLLRLALAAGAIGFAGDAARAADGAGADVGAVAPAKAGSLSVASLKKLDDFAKSVGVQQLPPFLTAAGIEQVFPFIGPDGMDADQPIGVIFFAAPHVNTEGGEGVEFVLPVKPAAATAKVLEDAGAKPVVGHPGDFSLSGLSFRRTDNYLIFGPTGNAISGVLAGEADVHDQFKAAAGASPLAKLIVDVPAIRQSMPEQFDKFIEQVRVGESATDEAERMGQESVVNLVKNLGRLDLTLAQAGDELQVKLADTPMKVPAAGSFAKPGMPADVMIRVDVSASLLKVYSSWDKALDTLINLPQSDGKRLPDDQKQVLEDFLRTAVQTLAGGDAISIGVTPDGKKTVVYVVQQYQQPVDVQAELNDVAAKFQKASRVMDEKGKESTAEVQTYSDEGGAKVSRLQITNPDQQNVYADAVEKGSTVYWTFGLDAGHHVGALAAAEADGKMSGLMSGTIDLGKVARVLSENAPQGMPPAQQAALVDMLKGRSVNFSATGEGDALMFSVMVPQALVKDAVDFAMKQGGAGAEK